MVTSIVNQLRVSSYKNVFHWDNENIGTKCTYDKTYCTYKNKLSVKTWTATTTTTTTSFLPIYFFQSSLILSPLGFFILDRLYPSLLLFQRFVINTFPFFGITTLNELENFLQLASKGSFKVINLFIHMIFYLGYLNK